MAKISKDTPLAEITLRKYEVPSRGLEKRELVRKLCLGLGLLQPGDSRDVMVDVFQVLLASKVELSSTEIEKLVIKKRKSEKRELLGIAPSNIRRQILRLRDMFFVEKIKNNYRIKENSRLKEIFEENIERYYMNSILKRVKEYLEMADKVFEK